MQSVSQVIPIEALTDKMKGRFDLQRTRPFVFGLADISNTEFPLAFPEKPIDQLGRRWRS